MFYEVNAFWINETEDAKGRVSEKKEYEKYLVRAINIPQAYTIVKEIAVKHALPGFHISNVKETNFTGVLNEKGVLINTSDPDENNNENSE